MSRFTLLAAIGAAALTGCASDTTKIESAYVSPETYAHFDCQQIGAEFSRLSRKAEELGATVDKMAADDQAQAFVGIVLFWPALFFLEGGETQQTQQYAQLKGQMEALEKASVAQGCGADIRHVAAAAGTGGAGSGNTSSKLASLKMLYRDGAITEAEYIERRKALVDEQAKRELEMMERQKAREAQRQAGIQPTPESTPSKLKVAILPTGRGGNATQWGGTTVVEDEILERIWRFIRRDPSLELVYSTASPDYDNPRIENYRNRYWKGVTEQKPIKSGVYSAAAELNADLVVMVYWDVGSVGRRYITLHLFDVKNDRVYKRSGWGSDIDHVDDFLKYVFREPLAKYASAS